MAKGSQRSPQGARGGPRTRQERTREKIAAQRAAQARREARRRLWLSVGVVVVVIGVVAGLVAIGLSRKTGPASAATAAPAALVSKVEHVPNSVLDAAPTSAITNPLQFAKGAPALRAHGKPEIVYVGAEYCPHCAAQRWAMINALSRFGTFSNLHTIRSAVADGDVPTFSFYQSSYHSRYVSFAPTEQYTNRPGNGFYIPLQPLTALDKQLLSKYDASPYVPSSSAGAIPFIDIGGRYIQAGTEYNDQPLVISGSTLTWNQIAADMYNTSNPIGQGIDASANLITAAICQLTGGQPGSVCTVPAVVTAAAKLPK